MLTAWCLTVAFCAPWVVGTPVVWLARGCRPLRPKDWLWAPFYGLAAVAVVFQNLVVFCDIPLRDSVPCFWGAVALAWLIFLGARSGRTGLRFVPLRVVGLTLAVYLSQGVGVWAKGVEEYRGNLQSDQYHYVVIAQFLMDEPQSTGWADVGHRAWLAIPLTLKEDRLGQSVIHGFVAVTAGRDALDLYFPVQLLGPALLCPATLLLAAQCGLSRRIATVAALGAGLMPGVTYLLSSCYLSHILCLPALVAFLAVVARLARGGGWRTRFDAVTALALGFSVYTEFAPLFLGVAAVALVTGRVRGTIGTASVLGAAACLVVALGINGAALKSAVAVATRGAANGPAMTLGAPVSVWAACVWAPYNDAAHVVTPDRRTLAVCVVACFALAALGWARLVYSAVRAKPGRLPAAMAIGALCVPPLAAWFVRPEGTYVISKLVWTLSPLLVLGVASVFEGLARLWVPRVRVAWRYAMPVLFALFVTRLGYSSFLEQQNFLLRNLARGETARVWNNPDLQQVCAALRAHPRSEVIISLDGDDAWISGGALCYYGRQHAFWFEEPRRTWMIELSDLPAGQLTDLTTVSECALVVLRGDVPVPPESRVIVENRSYRLAVVKRFQHSVRGGGLASRTPTNR